MLYDSYRSKIQKVVDFMRRIFAHMVLIIVAFSAVLLLVAAFLATKGIILDVGECKSEIYYGQSIGFEAKALFSSVRYEYSEQGTDKWSEDVPKYPGKYSVRAVSNGSFGSKKHTKTQNFTILPLDIELKATESSIQYGVTPTPNSVVLKNGDSIANLDFEFDAKTVGSRKVKINADTLVIKNVGGRDVTKCYNISTPETDIEITKRVVNITTGSISTEYNGKPVSCTDYEITGGGSLADGDTIKVVSYPSVEGITKGVIPGRPYADVSFGEISSVKNEIKFCVYDSRGIDVTENYELILTFGEISVKPKHIVFHTNSAVWTYDDTVHSDKEYTVKDLIEGHRFEATGFPELIYPTSSPVQNFADIQIFDENGNDVTEYYDISYDMGYLTVNKRPLVIKTGSGSWVYDGKTHYCDKYEIITNDGKGLPLIDGHKFVVDEHKTVTDVASVENKPIGVHIYADGDEDFYKYYDVSYDRGTLNITKRPIIIRTESGSWMYDGTEHSAMGFEILPGNSELNMALAEGEIFEIQAFTTIKNVGTVENSLLSYTISTEEKKTHSNYDITYEYGTLTVTKRPILVQTGSMTWVYDGEEHSYLEATAILDPNDKDKYYDILPGHKIQVRKSPKITDVGTAENIFEVVGILENGVNLIDNYDISYTYGTIEITKRPVTVLTGSAEWIYDGQSHSTTEYSTISYYDFVIGHRLDVSVSSSITNAGYTDNVFEKYDVKNKDGVSVFGNYDIKFEEGTLTIIPRPITVTSASDEKRYDGTPLTNSSCHVATDSPYALVDGHEIRATVTGARTDIGDSPNTIDSKSVIIFANGVDISYNYDVQFCYEGTLEVLPAAHITVITDSASKVYDGTPLISPTYTSKIDGKLLDGHSLNATVDGSITEVGKTQNTGYAWVTDRYGNDITEQYYTIEVKFGTLEVKKAEDKPIIYAKICTGKTGYVYLRMHSYGDLIGKTWYDAKEYDNVLPGGYSYNYLTSFALKNYGAESDYMFVTESGVYYFLPYYPSMNGKYDIPSSDTVYSSNLKEYELEFFMLPNNFDFEKLKGNLGEYSAYEKQYSEFVYANYLNVDASTMKLMFNIIEENGFDASQPDIINRVAEYIQNAATYNIDYDTRLDKANNMVVAFLNRYKEGKCTHFAASATMLFRALGIPARYVEGFALATKAGEFVDVTSPGHAWVEVYLDGIGWIPVEVTPGDGVPGGVPGGTPGDSKPIIDVTPKFVYKDYDGSYLYAENEVGYNQSIKWLIDNGYSYTVEVKGERLNPGSSESTVVSFEIYDKDGKKVTSEFEIRFKNGVVRVHGKSIKLYLYQIQKYYDGTPLEYEDGDYEIIDMPEGYTLDLDINISITGVGFLTLDEINKNIDSYITYRVYSKDGDDITDAVSIVFDDSDKTYIPIKIDKCEIELTTASEKKEYEDGIELTNEEVRVSKGNLAPGHKLYANAIGIITDVGMVYNEIDPLSVYVLDADGNDVTGNYEITVVLGILEITPADTED